MKVTTTVAATVLPATTEGATGPPTLAPVLRAALPSVADVRLVAAARVRETMRRRALAKSLENSQHDSQGSDSKHDNSGSGRARRRRNTPKLTVPGTGATCATKQGDVSSGGALGDSGGRAPPWGAER
ncbi:unnamed protein product [Discosporangium mesarthrocarpum]